MLSASVVDAANSEVVTDVEDGNQAERNKAVIRRFVEEVQNGKDFDAYDELNDPDFVNLSSPPGVPTDREGGKLFLQAFAQAYPDATFTIDDQEDDVGYQLRRFRRRSSDGPARDLRIRRHHARA